MGETAMLTNIGDMIDLAIGTPEVGTVDFCMLQTVLHCLAQQLAVLDKNVELRNTSGLLMLPPGKELVQSVTVNEYIVETDGKTLFALKDCVLVQVGAEGGVYRFGREADPKQLKVHEKAPAKQETLLIVERIKKEGSKPEIVPASNVQAATGAASSAPARRPSPPSQPPPSQPPPSQPPPSQPPPSQPPPSQPPSSQPPPAPAPAQPASRTSMSHLPAGEKVSLVTWSKFNLLETVVEDLKNRVYGSMPKNEDILEEVRSQTNLKAITDMWTSLNVSSRLEAAEAGVAKLSSLVQDLIGESTRLQELAKKLDAKSTTAAAPSPVQPSAPLASVAPPSGPSVAPPSGPSVAPPSGPSAAPPSRPSVAHEELAAIKADIDRIRAELDELSNTFNKAMQKMTAALASSVAPPSGPSVAPPSGPSVAPPLGPSAAPPSGPPVAPPSGPSVAPEELAAIKADIDRLRAELDDLSNLFNTAMQEMSVAFEPPPSQPPLPKLSPVSKPEPAPPLSPGGPAPEATERRQTQIPERRAPPARRPSNSTADLMERLAKLEKRIQQCCESINKNDGTKLDQMNNFQDQLEHLSKQVADLTNDLSAGKLSPDLIKDLQGLMELFQTVQDMQGQLKEVHETALQLAGEKEDRQAHINALLEQIEILKTIKLDREDMVEAMADKADLRMLARKVSHDQFEMACDDLSRGLEHAIGKLNVQESLWQLALDDIQREIESKLDKMELSPIKEFFNNKLRQLQENLKKMSSLRQEAEAAGTKRKLLRDVNCISCDAQAVMATEACSQATSKPLAANLSMKPYLTYELDAIRKAQATNMPQRNMHDWETIDKQMSQPKPSHKVRSETDKHICNRYCGGSHTVTTPAQRVARTGHFIKQWGPDVVPLSSGYATGDDGRMYKVSPVEGANVGPGGAVDATCTKKTPPTTDAPKPTPKPLIISAECRCLE